MGSTERFCPRGTSGSVTLMVMNDTTPDAVSVPADEQPVRPLQLGRPEILKHMLPKAVPDRGVTPLDVAGFCSSI